MNKKIFLGAGALVLVVAGAFAGKISAKFAPTTNLYYKGATCKEVALAIPAAGNKFLTAGQPGTHQAIINTSQSALLAGLYATSTCIKPVYLAP